jgi:hemerythrin
MPFLEWTDDLDVHVNSMNSEHKRLIDLMNKLYDLNEGEAPKDQLIKALTDLKDYTIKHFKDEEKIMEKLEFPKLNNHKFIHKNLLEKIDALATDFIEGPGDLLPDAVFSFLRHWLSAHIKGIDGQYGRYHLDHPEKKVR